MADQIAFSAGDFRLDTRIIRCTLIGETPEETEELGDRRFALEFGLEQVLPPAEFDHEAFHAAASRSRLLISQFNEASRISEPISRFLGYFRILESLSYSGRNRAGVAQAILANSLAAKAFVDLSPEGDFEEFVDRIVDARHNCAHLKLELGFGYTPLHPGVRQEVEPLTPVLEALVWRCITSRGGGG